MLIHSIIPKGIYADYDVYELEHCNIVYMCIKQARCSEYQIPDNLEPLVNQLIGDIHRLSEDLYEKDWTKYCYLTIKRQYVQPNTVGNRDGWHIDGFKSDQENFIWSDHSTIPTEVCIGEFDLTNDHEESLIEMQDQANKLFKYQLNSNTLYELNQECVHRPTVNNLNKAILRTFIKVTYSKELFNCFGNAWNYKLPHIKPKAFRGESRNHSVL